MNAIETLIYHVGLASDALTGRRDWAVEQHPEAGCEPSSATFLWGECIPGAVGFPHARRLDGIGWTGETTSGHRWWVIGRDVFVAHFAGRPASRFGDAVPRRRSRTLIPALVAGGAILLRGAQLREFEENF